MYKVKIWRVHIFALRFSSHFAWTKTPSCHKVTLYVHYLLYFNSFIPSDFLSNPCFPLFYFSVIENFMFMCWLLWINSEWRSLVLAPQYWFWRLVTMSCHSTIILLYFDAVATLLCYFDGRGGTFLLIWILRFGHFRTDSERVISTSNATHRRTSTGPSRSNGHHTHGFPFPLLQVRLYMSLGLRPII